MEIRRVDRAHADGTVALLDDLGVSLFGVRSRSLHAALVEDGVRRDIDCRIAAESGTVWGVVLAAPASYWSQGAREALAARRRVPLVEAGGPPLRGRRSCGR